MFRYCGVVDRGMVHLNNDDAAFLNEAILTNGLYEDEKETAEVLFAVADGIGSLENSHFASKLALKTFLEYGKNLSVNDIENIIRQANSNILEFTKSNKEISKIGTTLTGVYINQDKLTTFNVGNSRVYRFRNGILQQLTKDHSLVQSMIDLGTLSTSEAKTHQQKNIITRFLGTSDVTVSKSDVFEQPFLFKQGDLLLLCSDGLLEHLNHEDIANMLSKDESIQEKARNLLIISNERGGIDNTTIVLVERV